MDQCGASTWCCIEAAIRRAFEWIGCEDDVVVRRRAVDNIASSVAVEGVIVEVRHCVSAVVRLLGGCHLKSTTDTAYKHVVMADNLIAAVEEIDAGPALVPERAIAEVDMEPVVYSGIGAGDADGPVLECTVCADQ